MYLKSLTLKGFKSFAQPTTFAFETGVTCVVGPNGSGKSNVVDALAWVMGEQGAKTLRGGKMEDVIFAGTATKGPLGRAEVILTIDNSDGALPIEYTEVTISRTLFRNGGSEYAINGQSCRLLDVQELLSDSGLGREMHVIVGQGQLDAVLRATPEERRGFIEEAAGILKHRRRKEKTIRKLDAMQVNLTRLSDLAGEIRRQLKPLGRQAEVAREAQTIASVARDARARILADDVVAVRATIASHSRGESERKTERVVLQDQLDQVRLRQQRLESAQVGDAVDLARQTAHGLEAAQERLRGLYSLAVQRVALLGNQSDGDGAPSGVTEQTVTDAAAEAQRLRGLIGVAEEAWRASQQATTLARAELDTLDEQISAQSALVSRHDLELSKLAGQFDAASSRLAAVRGEVLRQQNALDGSSDRRKAAQAEFDALDAESALGDAGETDLDAEYESAQGEVAEAEAEMERLRDELHTLERERDALSARVGALSLALDQKDGSSAVVAAGHPGIRGLVAEHVQVEQGFEAAVAAALGPLTDAVLADDRDAAVAALEAAAGDDLGRVAVVLADGDSLPSQGLRLPDGVVSAGSVVRAPAGILALLGHTVIADDVERARDAWRQFAGTPDADRLTVITRSGDVLSRWVLRGGSGAQRSRLELFADRDAATHRHDEVVSLIDRARFALAEQRGAHGVAKEQSTRALAELRDFDAKLAAHTEKLGRARMRLESTQGEAERLERALAASAESVAAAEAAAELAREALDEARAKPRPVLDTSAREGLAAALEVARNAEVERRLQVETAKERVRGGENRAAQLKRQLEAERVRAEEAARRAVIRRRQVAAAESVVAALPAVLDAVDRSVSEARVALAARESERSAQNSELSALRNEELALRERLHALSEDVHGIEMQLYEARLHLTTLLERAGTELGLAEEVLVAEYGPEVPVPLEPVPLEPGRCRARCRSGLRTRGRSIHPLRARRTTGAPRAGGASARPSRSGEPARARGVRGARAAAPVPHRATRRPHQDPRRPAHDHRGDRREDAAHLRCRIRRHP